MTFDHIPDETFQIEHTSKEDKILFRKRMSEKMSYISSLIKGDACFACGKKVTGFCNSHSIPRFCLESIANNGLVIGGNAIIRANISGHYYAKTYIGIKEAGTFRLICRECDSTMFQNYENPESYLEDSPPPQKVLAEIALKNYLEYINKRKYEIAIYEDALSNNGAQKLEYQDYIDTAVYLKTGKEDLKAYIDEYKCVKKYLEKGENQFYIVYYKVLNYVAPIAVQVPLNVLIDLEGLPVNDILSKNPNYKFSYLHLCIFPLKDKTAILLFTKDKNNRYKRLKKQLSKKDNEEKLGIINYLVFLYCEDYYLSKTLESKVDLKKLRNVASLRTVGWSDKMPTSMKIYSEEFNLSKWRSIPNLLSESYKVR